jgi:Insulinase (Peptidase family M16)
MILTPLTSGPWYEGIWRSLTPTLQGLISSTGAPILASAGLFNARMFHLSNGMQVVWIPDRRAPVVTHMLWYRVGSADETPGKSGLAHFFEHIMFKGTTNYPEDAYARLIGRVGGELNAFTSLDYTAYFATVGTDSLELVMALEADCKENLIIGAAGAISGAELTEALDRVFGELPERGMTSAAPAAVFVPSDCEWRCLRGRHR